MMLEISKSALKRKVNFGGQKADFLYCYSHNERGLK